MKRRRFPVGLSAEHRAAVERLATARGISLAEAIRLTSELGLAAMGRPVVSGAPADWLRAALAANDTASRGA